MIDLQHMTDSVDVASPKTQRRLWRRVWISLALFLALTLLVAWVAIDQGGKADQG